MLAEDECNVREPTVVQSRERIGRELLVGANEKKVHETKYLFTEGKILGQRKWCMKFLGSCSLYRN